MSSAGFDRDLQFELKYALLESACREGRVDEAKELIAKSGKDLHALLNAKDEGGSFLLFEAAHSGKLEIVRLLVESGVAVDQTPLNSTPLHAAASAGNLDVLRYLHSRGAALDAPCRESGRTPLMSATFFGHKATALWLIEQNAVCNDDRRDHQDRAVIDIAAIFHEAEVFFALAERGVLDARGVSPLELLVARRSSADLLDQCLAHPVYCLPMMDARADRILRACGAPAIKEKLLSWRTQGRIKGMIGSAEEVPECVPLKRRDVGMAL